MLRKFFREYLRHFHFQTSGNCRHQTFLFSTIRFFQTSDTLFSNLIYFQRSDVFIFKHQIFQNIWHFYFQTLDIFKQLTLYFQTSDMLKHLTFVFSNLRYFQISNIFIFKPQIFSEIWHFHFQHQILQLHCRFLGSSIGWRQILLTAQTLLRNQILNQNGILWFVRKKW